MAAHTAAFEIVDIRLKTNGMLQALVHVKPMVAVNAAVVEHLSERKSDPDKVQNLFKKPEVRYAAADEQDKA